jgi:hypothetical protein
MSRDIKQLKALFLTDPDGGSMEISSDLRDAGNGDNSMQFTVTNPETGRRFAITFGIAELASESLKVPTAALEKGDGRDAWLLTLYELLMQQNIVTSGESYLSLRCVGVPPTEAEFATAVQRAIDAALSQKAGEQQ